MPITREHLMPEPTDPDQRAIKSAVLAERRASRIHLTHHAWFASRLGDAQAVRDALSR